MLCCEKLMLNATTIDQCGLEQPHQAIAVAKDQIIWCGAMKELPSEVKGSALETIDCQGSLITPGLIDCHTHLVYAGDRAHEFKMRLDGATYADIAKKGGGILSTVEKTREASTEELIVQSLPRLLAMKAQGVTTVEVKSGYGLDLANELKILRVARTLEKLSGVSVKTTFLGAHAIPTEYQGKRQAYVDYLCDEVLPAVVEAGLADAMDVFCETIAFSLEETEQLFIKAAALSLPIKCHAEQLTALGASALAARFGALSCDHLEYLDNPGAKAMAAAGTVGVLLPGAYYFLREKRQPPVELLRKEGIGMAIATDCNPGSSPTTSLLLMMSMACQFFSLTIPEVLSAVTYQAAKALGIAHTCGIIKVGKRADLVRWFFNDSARLCYYFGHPLAHMTMIGGEWVTNQECYDE